MTEEMLSVEEARRRYPDEWVCLEVIQEDEAGRPRAGFLVAHARDKRQVLEVAKAFHSQKPDSRAFFFFTGTLIPEGAVVVLAEARRP